MPVLQFAEPFFFFLVVCLASLCCIVTLFEMRTREGRTKIAVVRLIVCLLILGVIFVLSSRKRLAFPTDAVFFYGLVAAFTFGIALLVKPFTTGKLDGWAGWLFALIVGYAGAMYLMATFWQEHLDLFRPAASLTVLGVVFVLTGAIVVAVTGVKKQMSDGGNLERTEKASERSPGFSSRLVLGLFVALAVTSCWALPLTLGK